MPRIVAMPKIGGDTYQHFQVVVDLRPSWWDKPERPERMAAAIGRLSKIVPHWHAPSQIVVTGDDLYLTMPIPRGDFTRVGFERLRERLLKILEEP